MSRLAQIVDADALEREEGPRGRMSVDVLDAWLARGETIELTVPTRLVCAVCDGGGCDRCGRSGALRLELDEAARRVRLTLPKAGRECAVRLVRPLGEDAGLAQLTVLLRIAPTATAGCALAEPPPGALAPLPPAAKATLGLVALGLVALGLALTSLGTCFP